jgi:hypothetical protein
LTEACFTRGYDLWAMEVKGRLENCIDLPAEEAIYHLLCYACFLKNCAKAVDVVPSGRPVNDIAQMTFEQLCEY